MGGKGAVSSAETSRDAASSSTAADVSHCVISHRMNE